MPRRFGRRQGPYSSTEDLLTMVDLRDELIRHYKVFSKSHRVNLPKSFIDFSPVISGPDEDARGLILMDKSIYLTGLCLWWFSFYKKEFGFEYSITNIVENGESVYICVVKDNIGSGGAMGKQVEYLRGLLWCLYQMRASIRLQNNNKGIV